MKLVVYSYFPVLQEHHAGGAQVMMHDLLLGFARSGLKVTVICPKSDSGEYLNATNIHILPVLYEAEDRELLLNERIQNLHRIAAVAKEADVIWTLDRPFPLRMSQPIVLTWATMAYQMEIDSLLSLNWDVLVVPSAYLWNIAKVIVGPQIWEGEAPPIKLIPNGVDTAFFCRTEPERLALRMGLQARGSYLLFPHRPEPEKGFDLALDTLHRLVAQGKSYKLFIPTGPLSIGAERKYETEYINALRDRAAQMCLEEAIVFHEWIPRADLPSYFSLGEWSLALGSIPEGFGLTPVQAISCGTPVVSTRAGALKGQFPEKHGVVYVDFGAVDQVVSCILDGWRGSELAQGRAYVKEHYSLTKSVEGYIDCFKSARKSHARYRPDLAEGTVCLSPWCDFYNDAAIWHDLKRVTISLTTEEVAVIKKLEKGSDLAELIEQHRGEVTRLLNLGVLVTNCGKSRNEMLALHR